MIVYIFNQDGLYVNNAFLDANIEEVFDGFYTELEPNTNLLRPKWNGIKWIEDASEEEVQKNQVQKVVDAIKLKYEFHKKNGWDSYQNFRAKVILDISSGIITMEQAFLIEHDLKIAYDRIAQNGDWKTAYYELSQVTASQPFVQPYLTMALQFIDNYIQTNYDN